MTKGLDVKRANNPTISASAFLVITLALGQPAQADELILGGNQTINNDTDVSTIVIGNAGTGITGGNGNLTINNGARLTNYDANAPTPPQKINGVEYHYESGYLGLNSNTAGTATVTGTDSLWDNSGGELHIGHQGQGTLTVAAGGNILSDQSYIGYATGSQGTATVTGTDSVWDSVNLYIGGSASGAAGQGELIINDGATVSAFDSTVIWSTGRLAGQGGVLDGDVTNYGHISPGNLDNPAGVLTITDDLTLASTSTLTLNISDPTHYDQLLIDGNFIINGLLELDFSNFTPSATETTYDLIHIGNDIIGAWDNFNLHISTGFDTSLLSYSIIASNHAGYAQMLRLTIAENSISVPEPASILLIGLAGLIMQWQRHRNQSAY